jgi:DNA processing protein
MKASTAERIARAGLMWLAEPNDQRMYAFVQRVGAIEAYASVRRSNGPLDDLPGAANYRARLDGCDPERQLALADRHGARLVVPGDLEWPSQLGGLGLARAPGQRSCAPPLGLWVRGRQDLRWSVLRSVAMVGSRAATGYGSRMASELAAGLADRRWSVLSGGAYGIDAAAHRGSLAAGGITVCVLACGVDVPYPRGNASLFEQIVAEGVLVSELSPGRHPGKVRFLDRNRLIAGLTAGTVVVEASYRSGALNTASWARRLNRPVLAVPGPATSPLSQGVHREIRERGAELVTDAGEIVAAAGTMGEALAEAEADVDRLQAERAAAARREDGLDELAKRVLDALPARGARSLVEISRASGLSAELVFQRLMQLSALELATQRSGGWHLVPAAAPRAAE